MTMSPMTSPPARPRPHGRTALAWWFRVVGIVYVVLGVTFVPAINAGRIELLVPGFDGGAIAARGLVDYLFMFGLEELVLGSFLVVASFRPRWWEPLVWLLVALSAIRGIGHDAYMIASGYSVLTNTAFAIFHLALIATGLVLLRRFRAAAGVTTASSAAASSRATAPQGLSG
jgi:hypothetical protein